MLENFLLDYREYNNFLKGKKKIDWYMIRSENCHLSSVRVNDKTIIFISLFIDLLYSIKLIK